MKKIFHLASCPTCRRIIKEVNPGEDFIFQDVKLQPITEKQLNELYLLTNSYSELFNKQARKYRELGLHKKNLTEEQIKNFILNEYTFLRRPIFVIDKRILR